MQQKLGRLQHVNVFGRIKVVTLMGLEMIVSSIAQVVNSAGRARRRLS